MESIRSQIRTQIVTNPHKGNSLCVSVFGVDTPELVESYSLPEMMDLIDRMQDALAELRAAQILRSSLVEPTLFDAV